MESGGGHRSGGAGPGTGAEGGAAGLLCHACGYQYPNAHPSAKQRRAHRKHCGKPASPTAVAAEEEEEGGGTGEQQPEGRMLFPGEGGEPRVGGDGTGASAAERGGGGSPGSAQEDVDKTERSSHDDAGAQVIVEKCVEDRSDVASGITLPETRSDDSGALNDMATQYSGKASLPEEGVPSVPAPAVGSVRLQDVSVPGLQSEPGYGEGVGPELSVSEMQNSNSVALASDATEGEISEQTNDVVAEPNGTTVTEGEISERTNDVVAEPNGTTVTGVDGTANTIGKDTLSEEKSVKGDLDPSCQENLQTEVGEGQSNTAVEDDSSDKNLSAVQIEDIRNDKPESTNQSGPILTSPVPNIEEPVVSGTQEPVGADDFHSEATETVKPQEQPDSTSVGEDHLDVPEQIDIFEGEHHPNEDGGPETISSAVGPVVNAEVISDGDADNMTKNAYSSDVTMGDSIQEDVTSNSVVPSQVDIVDLTESTAASEINMVNSTDDVEEKGQNEKSVEDLTIHENEVQIKELVEEKQEDKEIVADSISHLSNAVCSTDNHGVNEKETITEASFCNIPSATTIEEEKQIEEFIVNLAPEKTHVTSDIEDVEENKQIEVDVKTDREISVVCITEAIEEKDTTSEINAENIADNVEDKKQSEEISATDISDGISMICSTVNEEKMHNDNMTEDLSSHEKTLVHSTDNVEEKNNEETMVDPISHSIGMVAAIDSVEERKNGQTSASSPHATEEKKDGEPISEPVPSKISTVGGVGDVEEKQNEETAADEISGENSTQQSTYAAENGTQNKDAATVLVSDKSEVAEKTDAVGGAEENKETTAKEISTVQSTDDPKGAGQNEEIADKEVIVDSDRSHVSLKVLLADKNVETKEKKPSTKDRVLSFRRRSSKDNESPMKPGSPKAGSAEQDWNSPARLPAEKKSKGKKQQWVPFICCPSIH